MLKVIHWIYRNDISSTAWEAFFHCFWCAWFKQEFFLSTSINTIFKLLLGIIFSVFMGSITTDIRIFNLTYNRFTYFIFGILHMGAFSFWVFARPWLRYLNQSTWLFKFSGAGEAFPEYSVLDSGYIVQKFVWEKFFQSTLETAENIWVSKTKFIWKMGQWNTSY